ncbi:MAG: sulfotransferase family 2 domain-containing protein [Pseudomonadota bacterium]
MQDRLFWLHVKKSAGQSTHNVLAPLYREVDRSAQLANFIQSPVEDYNDLLNTYLMPLGPYQMRRTLFAKKFLYPNDFERYFKFAFVREPVDRCLSQFFYLLDKEPGLRPRLRGVSYRFDLFLDTVAAARASPSFRRPHSLHFQTHTAAMWDDVVDDDGHVLLDAIYRLEDFGPAIASVRERFGLSTDAPQRARRNTTDRKVFEPTKAQMAKIEALFPKDFDLYESYASAP